MTTFLWPQWIGATERGRPIRQGARLLAAAIGCTIDVELPVSDHVDDTIENGIVGRRAILEGLVQFQHALSVSDARLLLLGGDCSTDLGLIAHTNRQYDGSLNVVYFDAHADINTPNVSPSGAFHGMVLGHLLGGTLVDGADPEVLNLIGRPLRPDQIHYRGVRVFDDSETQLMSRLGIAAEPFDAPVPGGPLHLHIDLDVLDPRSFPFTTYPTPGGPSVDELAGCVSTLIATGWVRSIAVTECVAPTEADAYVLEPLLTVLRTWAG
jgi:arginase